MTRLLFEFIDKSGPAGAPCAFISFQGVPISNNCFSAADVEKEVERFKAHLDKIAEEARRQFNARGR